MKRGSGGLDSHKQGHTFARSAASPSHCLRTCDASSTALFKPASSPEMAPSRSWSWMALADQKEERNRLQFTCCCNSSSLLSLAQSKVQMPLKLESSEFNFSIAAAVAIDSSFDWQILLQPRKRRLIEHLPLSTLAWLPLSLLLMHLKLLEGLRFASYPLSDVCITLESRRGIKQGRLTIWLKQSLLNWQWRSLVFGNQASLFWRKRNQYK